MKHFFPDFDENFLRILKYHFVPLAHELLGG